MYGSDRCRPFAHPILPSGAPTSAEICPVLAVLPQEVAQRLLARAHGWEIRRNTTLFWQGDPCDRLFIVVEGWIKLYRTSPHGTEAVVDVVTRGDCCCAIPSTPDEVYEVSAEAATPARLVTIGVAALLETMHHHPAFALAALAAFKHQVRDLLEQIERLKSYGGAQRLASFLLDLCPPDATRCEVTLPYDKTLIAARLGMQPESLSRAFARLQRHGVTLERHSVGIESVARLHRLIDEVRIERSGPNDTGQRWTELTGSGAPQSSGTR